MQSSLSAIIPDSKLAAIENALLTTFNTTTVADITLLGGGFSDSAVYRITIDGKMYLLKSDTSSLQESTSCMEIAANAGVAPKVYYNNTTDGISISSFIQGKPLHAAFTSPDMLVQELARSVKAIHNLPAFPKESDLLQTVEGLVNNFIGSGMLTGPSFDEVFRYFGSIRKYYPWHDTDRVSSHNDLNPNNVLCENGKIWIVDWDAAFLNDRYVDLATAANFFITAEAQEQNYLNTYFGTPPDNYKMARFFVMRQLCRIIYAMLILNLADRSKPADMTHDADMQSATMAEVGARARAGAFSLATYEGQLLYGKALLNEALKNMRLQRFENAIQLLKADAEKNIL
ncbi:phosphotransferase [Chitinophagaceae bacterium MMS25-I14]